MPQQTTGAQSSSAPTADPASTLRVFPKNWEKLGEGQIAKRVATLRQNNQTLSPEEILQLLKWEEFEQSADEAFLRWARIWEIARNIFVLAPLAFTWLLLGLAGEAFVQNVNLFSGNKELTIQSFLYLWTLGFPPVKAVPLLWFNLPVVVSGHHILQFIDLVAGDIILISSIILLTSAYHYCDRRGQRKMEQLRIWLQQEADSLCNQSLVRSLGPGPENKRPVWAVEVHTAINELKTVLGSVESSVQKTNSTFVNTVNSFTTSSQEQQKIVGDLLKAADRITTTVDQLNIIYQQGKETYQRLESVMPQIEDHFKRVAQHQEASHMQLHSIATEISKASQAIEQLARPFAAANLSALAHQSVQNVQRTTNQQQVVLQKMEELETRLSQQPNTTADVRGHGILGFFGINGTNKLKKKR